MDRQIAPGLLSAFLVILPTSSLNITMCDHNKPESIGLLDAELPSYCKEEVEETPIINKFFIKEEPHAQWEGFLCRIWIKLKRSTDSFRWI
jgi:hypothetical protein